MQVLMPTSEDSNAAEEADWKRLSLEWFFADDCEADAIYDTI